MMPVRAAEGDGRLGPVGGERGQALALAAGQDDDEHLRFGRNGVAQVVIPRVGEELLTGVVEATCWRAGPPRTSRPPCPGAAWPAAGRDGVRPDAAVQRVEQRRAMSVRGHEPGPVRRVGRRRRRPCRADRPRRSRPAACRSAWPASAPGRTARSGWAWPAGRRRRRAGGPAARRSRAGRRPAPAGDGRAAQRVGQRRVAVTQQATCAGIRSSEVEQRQERGRRPSARPAARP